MEQRGLIFYQLKTVIRISITNTDSRQLSAGTIKHSFSTAIPSWHSGVAKISELKISSPISPLSRVRTHQSYCEELENLPWCYNLAGILIGKFLVTSKLLDSDMTLTKPSSRQPTLDRK